MPGRLRIQKDAVRPRLSATAQGKLALADQAIIRRSYVHCQAAYNRRLVAGPSPTSAVKSVELSSDGDTDYIDQW